MSLPDKQEQGQKAPAHVSTGAGIAVAFIWTGGVGLTIFVVWFMFIYNKVTPEDIAALEQAPWFVQVIMGALLFLPMMASFAAMRMVLGKDD